MHRYIYIKGTHKGNKHCPALSTTYLGIQMGLTLGSGVSSTGDLTGKVFVLWSAILISLIAASTSTPVWSKLTLCLPCGAGGGGVPRGSRLSNCNSFVSYELSFFVIKRSGEVPIRI